MGKQCKLRCFCVFKTAVFSLIPKVARCGFIGVQIIRIFSSPSRTSRLRGLFQDGCISFARYVAPRAMAFRLRYNGRHSRFFFLVPYFPYTKG